MAVPIKELVVGFIQTRKTFLTNFIQNRPDKEKQMMVILAVAGILAVDYFVLAQPCIKSIIASTPELAGLKSKQEELRQDRKNKDLIEKNWQDTTAEVAAKEKAFLQPHEMPTLIENLSKMAQDSKTKILSLLPVEKSEKDIKDARGGYIPAPVKIDGLGGVHELGRFLAKMESGTTFLRITDVRIYENPQDTRRHLIGMDLEAYIKTEKAK